MCNGGKKDILTKIQQIAGLSEELKEIKSGIKTLTKDVQEIKTEMQKITGDIQEIKAAIASSKQ